MWQLAGVGRNWLQGVIARKACERNVRLQDVAPPAFSNYERNKATVIPPTKLTGSRGTDEGSGAGRRVRADERCMTRRKVQSQEEKDTSAIGWGSKAQNQTEGVPFRESTRTIIRSRAGSSKDPRDDISMPCLQNNFNYLRYTKKNTKSNARNSGERASSIRPLLRLPPSRSPL